MTKEEYRKVSTEYWQNNTEYHLYPYKFFDYTCLKHYILTYRKRGRSGDPLDYNEVIIGFDTETSKKRKNTYKVNKKGKREIEAVENHVYLWTLSIRILGTNVCTLYGRKPSELIECVNLIHKFLPGDHTIFYCHNFPYDYTFLRKFMFKAWGMPLNQLNIKSHYPLYIEWENGLIFKDSLALAQRSLDKWTSDLKIEHKKLTGTVDHNKLRNQETVLEPTLIKYAEYDTLGLVEAIDKTCEMLGKFVYQLPYTATGIVRESVRAEGLKHKAHEWFKRVTFSYDQYLKGIKVYHGGYAHANRWLISEIIKGLVKCYDIASSYPFALLAYKYPSEKFKKTKNRSIDWILKYADKYAFMFKLILVDYEVSDATCVMPPISLSKCTKVVNPVVDNGRVLKAAYIETYCNEVDLELIKASLSDKTTSICTEVEYAHKAYLPRWFTDLVFQYFEDKTRLKTSDDFIAYMLAKIKVNTLYGLTAQRSIKEVLIEDYDTGDYTVDTKVDYEASYEKYINNWRSILPYFIGIWCTSYAQRNLFELCLGCIDEPHLHWIYSDTDSGYSDKWNEEKIKAYNNKRIELLKANGYDGVYHEGRMYYLGIVESEGDKDLYTEFVALGAKRYCGRNKKDGELHITVAGVPKRGAKCLKSIDDFKKGFIFDGETTGKKTHAYMYVPDIYIDENGNETGDSVDLYPCDYLLDDVTVLTWEEVLLAAEADEYIKEFDESEVYY